MIDLHLHLLPGVDDGPADEAASLVHAHKLARDGVRVATVTPHVGHPGLPVDVHTIAERTRALQQAIDAAGIDLRLHPGGEIFPDGARELGRAELDLIAHGPRGARWVLLEVPFGGIDDGFLGAVRHVRGCGFAVLIAHPERAAGFDPRFLLAHGIPAEPGHRRAWRSLHEQRVRAAIVAARGFR